MVLLEGVKDEDDFKGFVEEAKEWLYQWFSWIRPWKPTDVDKKRVAWGQMIWDSDACLEC